MVFPEGFERKDRHSISQRESKTQSSRGSNTSHSKGVMVWIAFCTDGFLTPILDVTPGAKIDSDYYCSNVIKPFYKEYIKRYPDNNPVSSRLGTCPCLQEDHRFHGHLETSIYN